MGNDNEGRGEQAHETGALGQPREWVQRNGGKAASLAVALAALIAGIVTSLVQEGHTERVRYAEFSPDGSRIVTASADGTARLWDRAGEEVAVLEGHMGGVGHAAFSPDGSQIVTCSWDNTARLWDLEGNETAVLGDHAEIDWSAPL